MSFSFVINAHSSRDLMYSFQAYASNEFISLIQ